MVRGRSAPRLECSLSLPLTPSLSLSLSPSLSLSLPFFLSLSTVVCMGDWLMTNRILLVTYDSPYLGPCGGPGRGGVWGGALSYERGSPVASECQQRALGKTLP